MTRSSFLALVFVLALGAAACTNNNSNSRDVASLDPTTTTMGSGEAPESVDAEEAMLAVTQCLRDGGIDIGDPVIDENGNPQLPPISFQSGDPGDEVDPEAEMLAMEEVMANCQHHLEGVVLDGVEHGNLVEMEDTFVAYAQCMRDHGIDMPDPEFSDDGFIDLGSPDAGDEGYQAAHAECKEVFTGSGIDIPGF
jgi:hypothetical protein